MASLRPDQQTHLLLALARCHLLAAGDSGVPAEQDAAFAAESTQRAVHLELGVAYSRRALAQMPMLREYFLKEPDFAVLRRVEAWREGWGNKTENRE
jgi:hypothetical protein